MADCEQEVSARKEINKQGRWEFGTQSAVHVHGSNCKHALLSKGDGPGHYISSLEVQN